MIMYVQRKSAAQTIGQRLISLSFTRDFIQLNVYSRTIIRYDYSPGVQHNCQACWKHIRKVDVVMWQCE